MGTLTIAFTIYNDSFQLWKQDSRPEKSLSLLRP